MNICILAGGSGTRLWPRSRKNYPKQFLPLITEKTLFQETVGRVSDLDYSNLYVICNEEHRFLVADQLREIKVDATIILEPSPKNTAPAITVLSRLVLEDNNEPTIAISADHYISDSSGYCDLVRHALSSDKIDSSIILFGVTPNFPATGYGYIVPEEKDQLSKVAEFKEKPSKDRAEEYINSKDGALWNSGMFAFRPEVMLQEVKAWHPDIANIADDVLKTKIQDLDFLRLDSHSFASFPDVSIDVAVLENSKNVYVQPFDITWSDVGTWKGLYDIKGKDENDSVTMGDVFAFDSTDNLVLSENKLIACLGVQNMAIIETDDAILVADLSYSDLVGDLAKQLYQQGRKEASVHREVHRPWGKYDSISLNERYQVKKITVNPGAKLSLQMHHHRAEHWIVVKGTALVTNGEEKFIVSENQSTYIPLGNMHRLENPGSIQLEMIEVQSGSYLGEDDIVRFEDGYGRK